MNLEKLTPEPWVCLDCGPVNIERPKRKPILVHEVDDAEFICLARRAFGVMMRRGWTAHRGNPEGLHDKDWNVVDREGKPLWQGDVIAWFPDPFTALCAAEDWYVANVESARVV